MDSRADFRAWQVLGLAKSGSLCCSSPVIVTILGSGSEGNALLLETAKTRILVDAGLSFRRLCARFEQLEREVPETVDAVLVTHAHGDHARHASRYARQFGCPVHGSASALQGARLHDSVRRRSVLPGRDWRIGEIRVRTQAIPHDAPQIALRFETGRTSLGLVTDLGEVPGDLASFLRGCDTLLLESNHDPLMLERGPYPARLKERVAGSLGHLSNAQAAALLSELRNSLQRVVLMHLSQTNNHPELARSAATGALGSSGAELLLAEQSRPLRVAPIPARQLELGLRSLDGS